MVTELRVLTEAEHAEPFATFMAYLRASAAMAAAETRERRARSDATRAAARARRMQAHAIIMDCHRAFKQDNGEAHDRWRAEHGRAW